MALDRTDEALSLLDEATQLKGMPADLQAELLVQKAMILRETGQAEKAELAERQAIGKLEDPKAQEQLRQLIEQLKK